MISEESEKQISFLRVLHRLHERRRGGRHLSVGYGTAYVTRWGAPDGDGSQLSVHPGFDVSRGNETLMTSGDRGFSYGPFSRRSGRREPRAGGFFFSELRSALIALRTLHNRAIRKRGDHREPMGVSTSIEASARPTPCGRQERTRVPVDVGTLQGSFVIEERPDHLEEAVLDRDGCTPFSGMTMIRPASDGFGREVELDLDALGASEFPDPISVSIATRLV